MSTPTKYITQTGLSIDTPYGLAIDYDREHILVCDYGNEQLMLCKLSGLSEIDTYDSYNSNPLGPTGALYHDGFFYVCNTVYHTIVRFRARDMSYKDHFGTHGTSGNTSSLLYEPRDITTDGEYLYISDAGNSRVVKLVLKTLAYSDATSNINGSLSSITGITYKRKGGEALFLSCSNKVIKFQTDFTYIEQNSADVTAPKGLAFKNDYLYVCDGTSLHVLSSEGLTLTATYTDTTLVAGYGIDIMRNAIAISDQTNDSIAIWKIYRPEE